MRYAIVEHYKKALYPEGTIVQLTIEGKKKWGGSTPYYYVHVVSNHDGIRYSLRGARKRKDGTFVHLDDYGMAWVQQDMLMPVEILEHDGV